LSMMLALHRVRALVNAFEQDRREIALAGVGQHREQDGPGGSGVRSPQRTRERGSCRDADKEALLAGELACGRDGFLVADREPVIEDRTVEDLWNEIGHPALDLVRLERLVSEQLGLRRLA